MKEINCFKKLYAAGVAVSILISGFATASAQGEDGSLGYNYYLNNEKVNEAFVGETLRVKLYGDNVSAFSGADIAIGFNTKVGRMYSVSGALLQTDVGNGLYPLDSYQLYGSYGDGSYGVWVEDSFLQTWANGGATINGYEGSTPIYNDTDRNGYVYLQIICDGADYKLDGVFEFVTLNIKAENAGNLEMGFEKEADITEAFESAEGYYFAGGDGLDISFEPTEFMVYEKPEDITALAYDTESGVLSWDETINRGCVVRIYAGENADEANIKDEITVDYGTEQAILSYFSGTDVPEGIYTLGVTALGCDNNANEVTIAYDHTFPAISAPENVAWNGKTLTWSEVAGATGYEITLKKEGVSFGEVITVPAGSTEKDLTEYLEIFGEVYAEVVAIADPDSGYKNSLPAETDEPLKLGAVEGYVKLENLVQKSGVHEDIELACVAMGVGAKTDFDGYFLIAGLIAGETHTFTIDYGTVLTKTIKITVSDADVKRINEVDEPILVVQGDAAKNNKINVDDMNKYLEFSGLYISDVTTGNFEYYYDLDKDGMVGSNDLAYAISKNLAVVDENSSTFIYKGHKLEF